MAEEWICAICLDDNQQDCHTLVPCNHRFHTVCIVEALRRSGPECPYCRGVIPGNHHDNQLNIEHPVEDEPVAVEETVEDEPVAVETAVEEAVEDEQVAVEDEQVAVEQQNVPPQNNILVNQNFVIDLKLILLTLVSVFKRNYALAKISSLLESLGAEDELVQIAKRESQLYPHPPPGSDEVVNKR